MLIELVVEGLGVIDRAELHLAGGSGALTGETGAGKTLLVAALGLLVGGRADKTLVRDGAVEARVDARFSIDATDELREAFDAADIEVAVGEEVELILSRSVGRDGRTKARVNGRPVTLGVLQDLGGALVEIAGQNEHQHLSRPDTQRRLLDTFAGPDTVARAAEVEHAVRELKELTDRLAALRSSVRDRARELDVLRFEITEIEGAGLRPGETEDLTAEATRLEHADTIASAVSEASANLKGEGGVGELLAGAATTLEGIADKEPSVPALVDRLRTSAVELADIGDELARLNVATDPVRLSSTRDRLGLLSRLHRKYGASDDEVLGYLDRSTARAAELEAADSDETKLEEELAAVRTRAEELATTLSAERRAAAERLSVAVEDLLGQMALQGARFQVALVPRDLYFGGAETVEFQMSTDDGATPRPLAKIASGGELSRIALALRLLTSTGTATTLIFDEVDAGVGGEAARAVGRCLAELGLRKDVQVLVVTHLPQVAAFAEHQYMVSRSTVGDRAASVVSKVEGPERVEELSRMLAGLPESERAREHAQELLELAVKESGR
jgi:DNA repair protein RecN (Recombination protein N)